MFFGLNVQCSNDLGIEKSCPDYFIGRYCLHLKLCGCSRLLCKMGSFENKNSDAVVINLCI